MNLHDRLKELRERRGFKNHKQLTMAAEKHGYEMALRRYGAIERGDAKPTPEEIIVICLVLGISADAWLFGDESGIVLRELRQSEQAVIATLVTSLIEIRDQ